MRHFISSSLSAFSTEEDTLDNEKSFPRIPGVESVPSRSEDLFRYLRYLSSVENAERLEDIKCRMRFLEWFRDFAVSESSGERGQDDIQDKFIPKDVGPFDPLSTNEGFLIILFYFCLMVGAETPRFFAIDNIDTSLNPRLCTADQRDRGSCQEI